MKTDRLEVRETDDPGLGVDVSGADETIAESTSVFDNDDLESPESRDEQPSYLRRSPPT